MVLSDIFCEANCCVKNRMFVWWFEAMCTKHTISGQHFEVAWCSPLPSSIFSLTVTNINGDTQDFMALGTCESIVTHH